MSYVTSLPLPLPASVSAFECGSNVDPDPILQIILKISNATPVFFLYHTYLFKSDTVQLKKKFFITHLVETV
jgi:hypothetical protein